MYNFKANEDILPLSEFRSNLAGCIARTRETGRPIVVTQNGRTAGVFVNASIWDEMQERLEKAEAYEDLLVAEGEADRGEAVSLEDFEKEILSRRAREVRRTKSKTSRIRAAV